MKLDPTDWRILKELQADGRVTNVALAAKVGLSPPPCLRRVRALEDAGVIAGYAALIDDLLAIGTTTALYFGTVHLEATKLLADLCIEKGQRALVGKVVMDDPASCPDYYRDADAATGHTRKTDYNVLRIPTLHF